MPRREAALASRLCYGVLQNRMLLDFWIAAFAKGKLQPVVRDILRIGVYQFRFMDKIPASAAVNEAVEQAKRHANFQAARLVNGVLRAMLREENWPQPDSLSVRYSHPQPLVDLLLEQYGAEKTERLLQCHNGETDTVLQVNTLKADLQQTARSIEAEGGEVHAHGWLENCLTVRGAGGLESLEAYELGWLYAQDAAAKLAVQAAGIEPGMQVLDCCAAPGGKSFAAAIAMGNRGRIISCDIHEHKLKLIQKGAERLGLTVIQTRLQDASLPVEEWTGCMDAVLADVPCSGIGVIRKKPDIRYRDLSGRAELMKLQGEILAQQAKYVKKNGVLVYSTCTILQGENEDICRQFLAEHPDFVPEEIRFPEKSGILPACMVTLLPCDHGTDGFFICKFRRKP